MTLSEGRKRLFAVEDEALIMMELKDRLERLGFEVCGSAARGENAVRRIAELGPDLVLMDVNLAGAMDGVEAARRVYEDYRIPVVFLTAYSEPGLIERAGKAGAFGYLVKPFQERDLYAAILVALERKRAEDRLNALNAELEERVARRTASLKKSNEDLEAFAYTVAHDLRAPLRGIDGFSRVLTEDYSVNLGETGSAYLGRIRDGVSQMSALIDGLLAYARTGDREMPSTELDPQALVRQLLAERGADLERPGLILRVSVSSSAVKADEEGLKIALRNLLDNALKFTRDVPEAAIEIGGRDEGGKRVLWVRDNGPGFDMQFHEQIFGLFKRLHRAQKYSGVGAGLALARRAMGRMGGRVWAESAPGKGATFYLEIPA